MKLSFIILPAIFFSAALFALEWMPLEEFNDLTRQGNTLVLSEILKLILSHGNCLPAVELIMVRE
ncbi:MAG: hypothetical protein V8T87_16840 [Victivallales bacterium]